MVTFLSDHWFRPCGRKINLRPQNVTRQKNALALFFVGPQGQTNGRFILLKVNVSHRCRKHLVSPPEARNYPSLTIQRSHPAPSLCLRFQIIPFFISNLPITHLNCVLNIIKYTYKDSIVKKKYLYLC